MSKTKTKPVEAVDLVEMPKEPPKQEIEYTIAELAEASKATFGVESVIVRSALKLGGKENYTMTEATRIVTEFKNKEVRN